MKRKRGRLGWLVAFFGILALVTTTTVVVLFVVGDIKLPGTGSKRNIDSDTGILSNSINDIVDDANDASWTVDVDDYFANNGEILAQWGAKESEVLKTEAEAENFLSARGFTEYPVVAEYNMDGEYIISSETVQNKQEKHPIYQTYYVNSTEELWTIYLMEDTIVAYPSSYMLKTELSVPVVFSESQEMISYDGGSNRFFKTRPKQSALRVVAVDRVDAKTLDSLTIERIGEL